MSVDTINQISQTQQYIQQKAATPQTKQDSSPSNLASSTINQSSGKANTNQIQPVADKIELKQSTALKNLDTVRVIEEMHTRLNNLVVGVRETNEGLARSSDVVNKMHGTLESLTKNFPPFAADSQERRDILMSYVALRKELIKLSVPPPPPEIYEKVPHMWDELFSQTGAIHSEALPQLDNSSVDTTIKHAEVDLSVTYDKISSLSTKITDALVKR